MKRALLAAAALLISGCSSPEPANDNNPNITVFAASSLTGTFTQLGKDFEAANPGKKVTFSFGASSTLATQINEGAPADLFVAANPETMKAVTDARNGASTPVIFVKNQLVIAVPKGNPKGIKELADLIRPGTKTAMCAEQVPCGAAAKKALGGLVLTPSTMEQDVKAALSKLKLGEVDAALVYRTDVLSSPSDVEGVEFPESARAINLYEIVVLNNTTNKTVAQAFLTYVISDKGTAVLTEAGFQAP